LPLLVGVTGWRLEAATQGAEFPLVLGGYLVRLALILYGLLALRAICLPGGLGLAHFRWAEPDVRRLDAELRWFAWVVVPTILVLRLAMSLNPAAAGGLVTRLGLLVAALAIGIFFYRIFHRQQGLLRRPLQRADAGLLYRAYPLWFPLLIAFPLVLLALILSGYAYTTLILSNALFPTMGMIVALIVLQRAGSALADPGASPTGLAGRAGAETGRRGGARAGGRASDRGHGADAVRGGRPGPGRGQRAQLGAAADRHRLRRRVRPVPDLVRGVSGLGRTR